MKTKITLLGTLTALALGFGACSKNDDGNTISDGKTKGNYVLSVSPIASEGVADYLLNAPSLDGGTITTEGNGVEQDGTYRYYVTHKNKFFSMLYGQGNPGAVTAYDLQDGLLHKLTNFQTETVQAFAPVNDDILMYKISRNLTAEQSQWYRVSTNDLLIVGQGQTNTKTLAGNGELAHFSWIKQVGNKVFAPYFCIKGGNFFTDYPDNAWIAVFSYPDMQLEKVITDDRTSFIGRYFTDGLAIDEKQDVYAFSSSVAVNNDELTSTKPSAITRINAGTTEFDKSYFFNVEEVSGGYNITNWIYLGNGKAVGLFTTQEEKGSYNVGKHLGIIDLYNKSIKWVSGAPDVAQISGITENNYTPKDGKTAYLGITLTDGSSFVYKVDAGAATATQGLKVEGGFITAISRLD